jgi:hypothetical protein
MNHTVEMDSGDFSHSEVNGEDTSTRTQTHTNTDRKVILHRSAFIFVNSPLSPPVSKPLTYRGVILITLLQAILNTFPPFA